MMACGQNLKPFYIHLNFMQFIRFNYDLLERNKKITYRVLLPTFFDSAIPTVRSYISFSLSDQCCLLSSCMWTCLSSHRQSGHSSGKSDQPSPTSCYCPCLFSPAPNLSLENQITFEAPRTSVAQREERSATLLNETVEEAGSERGESEWGGRRWENH